MTNRADFEKAFPPPPGITWNEQIERYGLAVGRGTTIVAWEAYCLKWAEWRDSQPNAEPSSPKVAP